MIRTRQRHVSHLDLCGLVLIDGVVLLRLLCHGHEEGAEAAVRPGALVRPIHGADGVLEVSNADAVQPVHAAADGEEKQKDEEAIDVPRERQRGQTGCQCYHPDKQGNDRFVGAAAVSSEQRGIARLHGHCDLLHLLFRQHALNGEEDKKSQGGVHELIITQLLQQYGGTNSAFILVKNGEEVVFEIAEEILFAVHAHGQVVSEEQYEYVVDQHQSVAASKIDRLVDIHHEGQRLEHGRNIALGVKDNKGGGLSELSKPTDSTSLVSAHTPPDPDTAGARHSAFPCRFKTNNAISALCNGRCGTQGKKEWECP